MNVQDALHKLPQRDPRPDLWDRIERDLRADAVIDQALTSLPAAEPEFDAWDAIAGQLDAPGRVPAGTPERGNRTPGRDPVVPLWQSPDRVNWVVRWGAAAAVAGLIGAGAWLTYRPAGPYQAGPREAGPRQAGERVTVAYSVETVHDVPAESFGSAADDRAEAFIARQCAEEQLACRKPEVVELRTQLGELKQEQERIAQEMATFGDDPALVRAQVKVENQRAEVTKELITLLRS